MHSLALYLSFLHFLLITHVVTETPPPYAATDYFLLNCGSSYKSTSLDGRHWEGDFNSKFTPPNINRTSIVSTPSQHDPSVTQLPYTTARIFHNKFTYSFPVSPGLKFVRLYFFPATYSGLDKSKSFSLVTANNFTLLSNFSAFLTVSSLKPPVSTFIKEFIIPVLHTQFLNITFIPSTSSYAFINGIEIVSIPNNLYMHNRKYVINMVDYNRPFYFDNTTALETMYRLNVGGNDISGVGDTGLFRTWSQDSQYLFGQMTGMTPFGLPDVKIQYTTNTPAYTAPEIVFQTSRIMDLNPTLNLKSNLTWIFTVDGGFYYLFRLHFCETVIDVVETNQRVFYIFINNQMAEADADVIEWSGGPGIPVYKEYVVLVPSGKKAKQDLWLALHPNWDLSPRPEYASAILNGVEIFKLNRSDGTLAGLNPEVEGVTSSIETPGRPSPKSKSNRKTTIAIIGGAIFVVLFSILGLVAFQLSKRSKSTKTQGSSLPSELCRKFSFTEIKAATNDFDKVLIIGVGGFGNVYKGYVDDGTTPVAIKRLKSRSQQGAHEFHTEIAMLSQLRHRHLVSLIGYCSDDNEMILVYDYMSRGNLRDHLYDTGNPPLSWKQRLEICIGAAHGLQYLHTDAKHMIIHRDVKTTNILLDEKWVAKVSDFGLSKIGPTSEFKTHVSTVVKGSMGYMDPEYYRLQQLTEKSDVYSFGVVLCEVLCARPPLLRTAKKNQVSLAQWVPEYYRIKMLDQIVDLFLKNEITPECLEKFGEIAVNCLLDDRTKRPSMNEVVWGLELALQMQESTNNINLHGEMKGPLFQELVEDDSDGMFIASSEGSAKSTNLSMIENFANKDSDCLLPRTMCSLNTWLQKGDERMLKLGETRPYSEITGVCPRCKEQIDWKRRYGKYKRLTEPAKCQGCSKRAVRQAYHNLCAGCAKDQGVCAKCCSRVDRIVERDSSEVEAEQKLLEDAVKNARERDRRSQLLHAMNKDKSKSPEKTPTDKEDKDGELFPAASLEEYAEQSRNDNLCAGIVRDVRNAPFVRHTIISMLAVKNARERDPRSLLRAHRMNKSKSKSSEKTPTDKEDKVGELFPTASLEEYAK